MNKVRSRWSVAAVDRCLAQIRPGRPGQRRRANPNRRRRERDDGSNSKDEAGHEAPTLQIARRVKSRPLAEHCRSGLLAAGPRALLRRGDERLVLVAEMLLQEAPQANAVA